MSLEQITEGPRARVAKGSNLGATVKFDFGADGVVFVDGNADTVSNEDNDAGCTIGIKMAEPGREVVVAIGDGTYLMLNSEIVTAVAEGLKLTIVVFDNHGYQCIKDLAWVCGVPQFGNELRFRDGKTGRHLKLTTLDALPRDAVRGWLRTAAELARAR